MAKKPKKPKDHPAPPEDGSEIDDTLDAEGRVIDWSAIKIDYIGRVKKISYEQLAKKWRVNCANLKRRAAADPDGTWADQRLQYETQVVNQALRRAFEDRVNALRALVRLAYRESMAHLQDVVNLRLHSKDPDRPDVKPLRAHQHRALAETKEILFQRAFAALKTPDDGEGGAREMPLPAYIPAAFLEIEMAARAQEGDIDVGLGEDTVLQDEEED